MMNLMLSVDEKSRLMNRMKMWRSKSEFIVNEGNPDIIVQLDWADTVDIHPYRLGDFILSFLKKANIPIYGEIDVEGVSEGRLFWDDFIDIGNRTYFYYKNEPTYASDLKEFNICRLICPICKELCGGVSDHLELTADILPPERQFHGCAHEHKWLSLPKNKRISYRPVDGLILSSVEYVIDPVTREVVERDITFDDE